MEDLDCRGIYLGKVDAREICQRKGTCEYPETQRSGLTGMARDCGYQAGHSQRYDLRGKLLMFWKGSGTDFTFRNEWDTIRERKTRVARAVGIWASGVNKYAMTMWRASLRKITTQDRLIGWGYPQPKECWLCTTELESFDHIFFGCSYSREVWRHIRKHTRDFLLPTDMRI